MLSSGLQGHVTHTGKTLRHIIKMKIKKVFLFQFLAAKVYFMIVSTP